MASLTTKTIPFLVILLVAGTLAGEHWCDCTIDLETYMPLLIPMGLAGVPLTVFKRAIEAKKAIDIEKFKAEIKKG